MRRLAALAAGLILACASGAFAQARSITLAWDSNLEPNVIGYIVYVGTTSGIYTETFDVGNRTTFTYPTARAGATYYLAVAAYLPGNVTGDRSAEVSDGPGGGGQPGGLPLPDGLPGRFRRPSADAVVTDEIAVPRAQPAAASTAAASVCASAGVAGCYTTQRIRPANATGSIDSLAMADDGRLFAIADGRRVIVPNRTDGLTVPALELRSADVRLSGLVLDPAFARTAYVFVGQTTVGRRGRELNIVRYRDVRNRLGEPAVVVSGLPLPPTGDAPFTVDDMGRIYVAIPSDATDSRDPYAGMVLRFEADGTVPADSRSLSPVLAQGFAHPHSLAWDRVRRQLWLTTLDGSQRPVVARLDTSVSAEGRWPVVPQVQPLIASAGGSPGDRASASGVRLAVESVAGGTAYVVAAADRLYHVGIAEGQPPVLLQRFDFEQYGDIDGLVVGPTGDVFVAVSGGESSASTPQILMLRKR